MCAYGCLFLFHPKLLKAFEKKIPYELIVVVKAVQRFLRERERNIQTLFHAYFRVYNISRILNSRFKTIFENRLFLYN